jgi:hypothetical protein
MTFDVWRNGQKIGVHTVDIDGDEGDQKVRTKVDLLVKIGPIPVFRYAFQSQETWRATLRPTGGGTKSMRYPAPQE